MEMETSRMTLVTDDQLIRRFLTDCKIRGLTDKTIEDYKGNVKIFHHFLEKQDTEFLTATKDTIREFVKYLRFDRKVSQRRIKNYFSGLSTFYEFLIYEGLTETNKILQVRKRYLTSYKKDNGGSQRKLISIEDMAHFINSIMDSRDKATALLMAKTGIRRGELIRINVDDIDWRDMSITLQPAAKRSNRIIFFDDETAYILRKWLNKRKNIVKPGCNALFISYMTRKRFRRSGIYSQFIFWAKKAGLHDPDSEKLEDHFTPHCCRHWFTTMLLRNGMPREYVKELRGDSRRDAIDIYHHIDREELRKSYLANIPVLGI